ncbi:MAG: dTDP-glucose 4,6-dehydratase [Chloroflexia bacterium]
MKLRGKNVLVTGGAGFIGSHLVDRLIREEPARLVVVDNFFLGREENLAEARETFPELKVYRLDASDLAAMHQVVRGEQIEVVFNLAVVPLPTSLQYPVWTIETNVGIAVTFCELARWGCIRTLIHCSSSEAYGTAQYVPMDEAHPQAAITPYAASKAAADQVVLSYWRTFGIDAAILRPFNTFGPRQNPGTYAGVIPVVIQRVRKGLPVEIHGTGEQTRDFTFVRDTAEAFVRCYEQGASRGRVINVATGQETSINELVGRLLRILGVPDHPIVHTSPRPGDVMRHCGDVRLARDLLGFVPPPLSDAHLEETVAWYLARE